jgi:hypothetical protein
MTRRKYNKEKIIRVLREHPELSARKWMRLHLRPSVHAIRLYFGSWNNARKAAGLRARQGREAHYTDEELLDVLRAHPRLSAVRWKRRELKPSVFTIVKRFGSWNRARTLAGLEPRPKGFPSELSEEEKERRVREALKHGDRWTLRRYALTYLKLTDGWAEETFNRWMQKERK